MAVLLIPKAIHCHECNFEGKSRVRGAGTLMRLSALALIIGGFYFWPLFLVVAGLMVYQLFQPARHSCPECGSPRIEELDRYRRNQGGTAAAITPEHPDTFGGGKPIEP